MARRNIVIPSNAPGGLESSPCEHFGICPFFNLVTIEDDHVCSVSVIPNPHNACRDCYKLIANLWEKGMDCLLVQRLGMFPFRMLESLAIPVLCFSGQKKVEGVLNAFLHGRLRAFTADDTCTGECES